MKLRQRHPAAAFTLIEIMVSLAIVAVIVTAIYSCWYSIVKGSAAAANAAAVSQRARLTMRMMEDSLLGACMYSQNGRYYPFVVDSEGDFSSLSFVSHLPESFLRSRKFGGAEIRRVNFSVEDGPNREKQLVLRQNVLLLDPDKDEEENPLIVAKNVKLFLVEFKDIKTGDWTPDWPYSNQIPHEVRIQLALGNQNEYSEKAVETMVVTVAPPAVAVRPEWQLPIGLGGQSGAPTNGAQLGLPKTGPNGGNQTIRVPAP